jgi:hypothetical protein
MKRFRLLSLAAALAAVHYCSAICIAQTNAGTPKVPYPAKPLPEDSSGAQYNTRPLPANSPSAPDDTSSVPANSSGTQFKTRPIPPPAEVTAPFSLEAPPSDARKAIEYRSGDQINAADLHSIESAAHAIEDTAALAGFELGSGRWSFQQLLCQALPDHIFLLYNDNNGKGDVSLFSAAISRSGRDRARIIPVLRRGFSPYTPAPVNPITIAEFNRIRDVEPAKNSADWLGTGLCYAALTGARPDSSPSPQKSSNGGLTLSFPPVLEVGSFGQATVRFVDFATDLQPIQWALTFNSDGRLLTVDHFAMPAFAVKPIPSTPDQHPRTPSSP